MKSLTSLIYSVLTLSILVTSVSKAQGPSVRVGIYDFAGSTASELYVLAPTVIFGCDVWEKSRLDLELSTGFSFNRTRYNEHYHYLYMIPGMATIFYNLPNPDSKIWPSIGMGGSLLGKADSNSYFERTHYSFAYGYHITGRLNISIKEGMGLRLDMMYNLLIPPVMEDMNLSGVVLTVGLNFPAKVVR